jgi:hypothetical protein
MNIRRAGQLLMIAKGERYKEPVALASVNEIAPNIRRDVTVGRTNST